MLIVAGDFNAKAGSQLVDGVIGPHRFGEHNSRGNDLIDSAITINLQWHTLGLKSDPNNVMSHGSAY